MKMITRTWWLCFGMAFAGSVLASVPSPANPVFASATDVIPSNLRSQTDRVGSLNGEFRVSESGAATYRINIYAPRGTAGVTPQVSLNYSSLSGNGIAGKGWSLGGLGGISRCRQTEHQDKNPLPITFSDTDRFCLDGQRLLVVSGAYGSPGSVYKTEIDSFVTVTGVGGTPGHPDYWEVERKDGSVSRYGNVGSNSSESKVLNLDGTVSSMVMVWALDSFQDSVGNEISYIYSNDAEGHRVANINYAYGAYSTAGASIHFEYEDRVIDPSESYVAGYKTRNTKRLKRILSKNGSSVVKIYKLRYLDSDNGSPDITGLSKLVGVKECFSENSCLPETKFEWSLPQQGFSSSPSGSFDMITRSRRGLMNYQPADINGDGYMDLVWLEWDINGDDYDHAIQYALSDGEKLVKALFTNNSSEKKYQEDADDETVVLKVVDYNADGRQDVAVFNSRAGQWSILLSTPYPDGEWRLSSTPVPTGITESDVNFQDLNSDGLLDLLVLADDLKMRLMEVNPSESASSSSYYHWGGEQSYTVPLNENSFFYGPGGGGGFVPWPNLVDSSLELDGDGRSDFLLHSSSTMFIGPYGSVPGPPELDMLVFSGGAIERYEFFGVVGGLSPGVDPSLEHSAEVRSGDFNKDGLSDLFLRYYRGEDEGGFEWSYYLNNGGGFSGSEGKLFGSMNPKVPPIFVDYNSDGYLDVLWHDTDNNVIKASLWSKEENGFSGSLIDVVDTSGDTDHAHIFQDVNADGVVDYVRIEEDRVYTYLGLGEESPNVITRITSGFGSITEITYEPFGDSDNYERLAVGSSGETIHFCFPIGSTNCSEHTYIKVDKESFYSDLNGSWKLPPGSKTLGKNSPTLEINASTPIVVSVASSVPVADNPFAKSSVSYYYGEAKIQASGRGSLGFQRLKTVDEQTGISTVTTYRQDWPFVGYPLSTNVYSEQGNLLKESRNTWDVKNISDWAAAADTASEYGTKNLGSLQPYISKSIEKVYRLNANGDEQGSILKVVTTDTTNDAYGNPTQITITTNGGGKKYRTITTNTYSPAGLPSEYAKKFGRLSKTVVKTRRDDDGDGRYEATEQRTSSFSYHTSGEKYGMLRSETVEPTKSVEKTTTHVYDSFGNRVRSWVSAKHPQTGVLAERCNSPAVQTVDPDDYYDARGRYANLEVDCLGRTLSRINGRNKYGSPTEVESYLTDAQDAFVTKRYRYTGGGYRYFEADSSGAFSGSTMKSCGSSGCPAAIGASSYTSHWGPGNSATPARVELAREYVDVLGRPIKKLTRGFDGTWIHQDIEYDSLGRVQRKSVPYYHGSEPEGWTTLTYDILGRVVSTVHPDGSSQSTDYNGFVTTHTNAKGQVKKETHNALGELVSVEDNLGTKVYYGYDAQGNLETTRHDNGTSGQGDDTVIAMEYDLLGRKTSMNDPDKGVWTYQYNAFGELETQTNAKGQTSTILYDGLGRKLSREDRLAGGQLAGQTTWVYDGPNGLGQLAHVADSISGYVKVVEYDNLGRPSKTVTSLGVDGEFGNHYEKVTYDQYGRAYQVFDAARNDDSYTDNGIEYRYNQYGYQHQVVDAVYNNGVTRKVYHTISGMDAWGNVTGETLGSGVAVRQKEYDGQTGRLKIVRASNASKTVQELEHEWDAIGNLESVHDTGTGGANTARNWLTSYGYDSLNRLTSTQWKKNGSVIRSDATTYYRNGNIKTKSRVGTYVYDRSCGCGPHAVTQAGNTTYQYDANGNMVRDSSGRKIAYTTFDKAYRMERGSTQVSFAYDTSRKRYLRTDTDSAGTQTTLYIGSVEKITHKDGSKQWKRYIGGNLMILQDVSGAGAITQSHTRYLLKDHLGSLQYILDAGGFVVQSLGFDPWGDRLNSFQNEGSKPWATDLYNILETTRGFTGHEMVDGLDIVHMNGRIYDSRIGRFLQADIIIDGANNTQGYNRYSYVHNNPLNATDPSGHFLVTLATIAAYAVSGKLTITAVVAGIVAFGQAAYYNAGVGDALIAGVSAAALTYWGIELAPGVNPGFSQAAMYGLKMGVIGGMTSILQGGNFGHGFVSAGVGSGIGAKIGGFSKGATWTNVGKAIGKMTLSGTISKVTGGKFANGAAAVAFAAIVSSAAQRASDFNGPSTGEFVEAGGVSSEDAAKGADLNVSPGEFVEGSRDYSAPRAAPYSSQGVIEEVVVRAQYTGARLAPLTYYINPTITSRQYVDRQMNALNRRLGTIVEYGSYALMPGTAIGGVRVISQAWKAAPLQQRRALVQGGVQLLKALSRNEMKGGSGLPTYEPIPYRAGVVEVTRDIGSF
ncbi:FG-GAP-like repeat-containing protein [Spongiibacter sp.]|uniref:FG-GAP-like repeat-containing protein n=1 Tax=Spongiibacter sp. TaxID=2024860 RepID=UPI000C548908|nr:FG-GAP-like repeat-containing protein [Spongiibacter sp.]MAY39865.1 hypothetical protein [Spongiibacter sp.]